MGFDNEFWVNCVRYRTRAEAYQRIDEMDINRIRNHLLDLYEGFAGENEAGFIAKKSDDELRRLVKDSVDIIYADSLQGSSPAVCIIHAGKDMFIFAGGFTSGGQPPSDEFEAIAHLNDLGMDDDFDKIPNTYRPAMSS